MAGMPGYLPNFCNVAPDYKTAIDGLTEIFDLTKEQTENLTKDSFLMLNDNEYLEIQSCDCSMPWIHQEDLTKEQWIKENKEEN